MPIKTDPAAGSNAPSILLVEEYGALSVAIGSALRKFAPGYVRHTAPTLSAARALAEQFRPELLVIDIDPPQAGLLAFLGELRGTIPLARLLAIGCGTSSKLESVRAGAGAIRFLEKPFELSDLGEAIQILSPSADSEDAPDLPRCLLDIDVADVVALLSVNAARSSIIVQGSDGASGELHFAGGHLIHAVTSGLTGETALQEMLRWESPRFLENRAQGNPPRTINGPWDAVLTTALSAAQPTRAKAKNARGQRRRKPAKGDGKKIVVIDDTELLLVFVEEILSSAHPELRISTAHTGTEGCRRAELINPDLILLDYSLPDITGAEVCRRLLENETTALIPIVMMSGHVPEMSATAQRYANVVATISKPFLSHELVTLVESTLERGRDAVFELPLPPAEVEPPIPTPSPEATTLHGNGHAKRAAPVASLPPSTPPSSSETGPANVTTAGAMTSVLVQEPEIVLARKTEELPTSRLPTVQIDVGADDNISPADEYFPPPQVVAPRTQPPPAPSITPDRMHAPPTALAVTLPKAMTVLVGLALRTTAVQMNAQFQIERLRARPITATVSLNLPPDSSPLPAMLQTGFDLDQVALNADRQIETVCLVPTRRALVPPQLNSELTIAEIHPASTAEGVEMTSANSSAMTVQLLSAFQIASVELSATFEVARLVLRSISPRARATLDRQNAAGSGVIFQTAEVQVNQQGHLTEIELRAL